MSQRSRREHKPTSKFLSYKTQELGSLNYEAKSRKTPDSPKKNVSSIRKQAAIHGRRKLASDEVEVLYVSSVDTSPELSEKSPEIRRSNRQHKPNSKLKEYIHSSHVCESVASTSSTMKATNVQSQLKKGVSNGESQRLSSKKLLSTSYNSDENMSETQSDRSKFLSVGLVDCFEGLTKDLAKNYPTPAIDNSKQNSDIIKTESPSQSLYDGGSRRGIKRSMEKDFDEFCDPLAEQGQQDDDCEPLFKRERLTPSAVRNLTKTKKSRRVTTVVETLDLANNKRQKTITRNNKLKVTKQYPIVNSASSSFSSSKDTDSDTSPKHLFVSKRSPLHVPQNSPRTSKSFQKKPVALNQPEDIREMLKKFLIMGTTVSNALSETLKHKEEELLSKSSSFEKKCVSLVHALAKRGADLEEDDMEMFIKLLDEEQEERRSYRNAFFESIRVSHLTNMALYSQMLRLLKTL